MSDQTPQLGNQRVVDFTNIQVIGLSGGGGITSINGDATAAQILVAGAGITITPGPAGTNTIAATGATGLTSLSDNSVLDTGPSIVMRLLLNGSFAPLGPSNFAATPPNVMDLVIANFAAGNPGIVSDPGGAAATDYLGADNTFRPIPGGGGITSINGDATAAQSLTPAALSGVTIVNGGGGGHTIAGPTSTLGFDSAGVVVLANGVLTTVLNVVTAFAGTYVFVWAATLDGVAAQFADFVPELNGAPIGFGCSGLVETAGQTLGQSGGFAIACAAGDTVSLSINHHGGGAGTSTTNANMLGFKISG